MSKWIVTAVDYGDSCDGKACVLAVCNTKEEANAYVHKDIEDYIEKMTDDNGECSCEEIDFGEMYVYTNNLENGCEWNIEKVDIEL